jgi:alkylation response protein AidB-like acyl-CoA dehydrogenase
MATSAVEISLLDGVKRIAPIIREHAAASEQQRRLDSRTVEAMQSAHLYRMCKPRACGGLEVDAMTALQVFEEVARLHPAAGWNLDIAVAGFSFGAWLSEEGAVELMSLSPDARLAGAFAPPGRAVPTDGGYTVTGRWAFASGAHQADFFVAGSFIYDDGGEEPRKNDKGQPIQLMSFLPASDVSIPDSWHTMGMRGTGSHDFAVERAFVPQRRTAFVAPLEKLPPTLSSPIYRLSLWFPVAALAAPALGTARAAIDALLALGHKKTPNYTVARVAERPVAQMQLARAEALVGAARAYLYESVAEAWESASEGRFLTQAQKIKIQLASSHAILAAADAVEMVHAAAGTSAIREEQPFEQYFRDIHVITQHAFGSTARFESVGKLMFDQPTDWPFMQM